MKSQQGLENSESPNKILTCKRKEGLSKLELVFESVISQLKNEFFIYLKSHSCVWLIIKSYKILFSENF